MREAKVLDLTGGWEDIVNNVQRHNARCRWEAKKEGRKTNKLMQLAIRLSLGTLLVVGLAFCKVVAPWLGAVVAVVLLCSACMVAGRVAERRKG